MAISRSRLRLLSALFVGILVFLSPLAAVATHGEGEPETGVVSESVHDLDGVEVDTTGELDPAPGVTTVVYFPKHPNKAINAGEDVEVLVGVSNHGEIPLSVYSASASLHLPYDHQYLVQNYSVVEFGNVSVSKSVQASFPYTFTLSKYLQPGTFDLVGSIFYEVGGQSHRSVFYNGTIDVVEASGFMSGETIFLVTLGLGMVGLFAMWIQDQFQKLTKKTRKTKKVETGTQKLEVMNNEWLQGTAFTQKQVKSIAQPTKSKKKK